MRLTLVQRPVSNSSIDYCGASHCDTVSSHWEIWHASSLTDDLFLLGQALSIPSSFDPVFPEIRIKRGKIFSVLLLFPPPQSEYLSLFPGRINLICFHRIQRQVFFQMDVLAWIKFSLQIHLNRFWLWKRFTVRHNLRMSRKALWSGTWESGSPPVLTPAESAS